MHFNMLCPLNKENVIFKGSKLESVLLSNAKWDTFIPSKIFMSFVELSVLYYVKNIQVASKLSPQNHFITKHILFLKQFHQLS